MMLFNTPFWTTTDYVYWVTPSGVIGSANVAQRSVSTSVQAASARGGPVTYAFAGGELPAGFTVTSSGQIYGTMTDTVAKTYTFDIKAMADGFESTRTFRIYYYIPNWYSTTNTLASGNFSIYDSPRVAYSTYSIPAGYFDRTGQINISGNSSWYSENVDSFDLELKVGGVSMGKQSVTVGTTYNVYQTLYYPATATAGKALDLYFTLHCHSPGSAILKNIYISQAS